MEKKIYTQEQIDEAILILEICGSNEWLSTYAAEAALNGPRDGTEPVHVAGDLAREVLHTVIAFSSIKLDHIHDDEMYLEAAALLRDGWRPGDKLYLIGKE